MQSRTNTTRTASETALLRELSAAGSVDREQLLTLLCEQAPPPVSDIPAMPEELRGRLEEKFGPTPVVTKPAERTPASKPRARTSLFAQMLQWLRETLRQHPLAYGGGMVAAACAIVLVLLTHDPEQPSDRDTMRGGAPEDHTAITAGIHWYWLGAENDPLETSLTSLMVDAKLNHAATLAETPTPAEAGVIIAIDPQAGAWLKRPTGDPVSFPAQGTPGSAEWPSSLKLAAQEALAAASKQ
jgi:hypothetical protein